MFKTVTITYIMIANDRPLDPINPTEVLAWRKELEVPAAPDTNFDPDWCYDRIIEANPDFGPHHYTIAIWAVDIDEFEDKEAQAESKASFIPATYPKAQKATIENLKVGDLLFQKDEDTNDFVLIGSFWKHVSETGETILYNPGSGNVIFMPHFPNAYILTGDE